MTINYAKCLHDAERLHASAKDGHTCINGRKYTLTFTAQEGVYIVTDDQTGEVVNKYNTRKITHAKKWLREFFAN